MSHFVSSAVPLRCQELSVARRDEMRRNLSWDVWPLTANSRSRVNWFHHLIVRACVRLNEVVLY